MAGIEEAVAINSTTPHMPAEAHGKNTHAAFALEVMDLTDPDQWADLKEQRVSCGWNYTKEVIDTWRDLSKTPEDRSYPLKAFFWITLPDGTRAGHVCLDRDPQLHPKAGNAVANGKSEDILDTPEARAVAAIDASRTVKVTVLHVLSAYQGRGLANATMDALETMATTPPHGFPECEAVELDTLDRRYMTQEGEDGRGIWGRLGFDEPRARMVVQDWYMWRGYVPFRREQKYSQPLTNGEMYSMWGVIMRKRVGKQVERTNGEV